ncbi:MAG: hypothetical protein QXQ91_00915 [Nanopusillaceae archaeon]
MPPRRLIKGYAVTTEALLAGMVVMIVVALMTRLALNMMQPATLTRGVVEGALCGSTLILQNTGRTPVTVVSAWAFSGGLTRRLTDLEGTTLNPGGVVRLNVSVANRLPTHVVIAGRGFHQIVLYNSCAPR